MTDTDNDFDPGNPAWWDEENQSEGIIKAWKESLSDYLNYTSQKAEHLKFDKSLLLKIIPHTGVRDARWYKFRKDEFNSNKHKAHAKLYDTIRNHLKALKDEAQKTKDAKAAAKQEKITQKQDDS